MNKGDTLGVFLMKGNCPAALVGLLLQVATAANLISHQVSRAGLAGVLGAAGGTNVQGEAVQKLDVLANETFIAALSAALSPTGVLAGIASEEMEGILQVASPDPEYVFLMDPLDGSSNIDVNISIGSIFSVHRKASAGRDATLSDFLQPGRRQVLAGYCLYGGSTMLVVTMGDGVHGFTLDPDIGEFRLSHEAIRTPKTGLYYSINEGNASGWEAPTRHYVEKVKAEGRSARYVGALVGDFHRNLLKGGIFLYPADRKNKRGKLRLLYEAAPLAFIMEQAGGTAVTGGPESQAILDVMPESLHQRVPLIIGSTDDVARALTF
jgi:fructose-1,6-bisphosphatase I